MNRVLAPFLQQLQAKTMKSTNKIIEKLLNLSPKSFLLMRTSKMYQQEALDIALRELYSEPVAPEICRPAMKSLWALEVENICFICSHPVCKIRCCSYGPIIGSTTGNRLKKIVWGIITNTIAKKCLGKSDQMRICHIRNWRVTFCEKKCDQWKNSFPANCHKRENKQHASMRNFVWICAWYSKSSKCNSKLGVECCSSGFSTPSVFQICKFLIAIAVSKFAWKAPTPIIFLCVGITKTSPNNFRHFLHTFLIKF